MCFFSSDPIVISNFFVCHHLRENKDVYDDEKKRQQLWVPADVMGKVKDIILDPHLRRGIKSIHDCSLCTVNYTSDVSTVPKTEKSLLELEDHTSS